MFSKMADWYRDWEDEQIRVLDKPESASELAPGWRRALACKMGQLSAVERQQLRDFSIKYQGWRFYAVVARLIVLFSLCGAGLWLLAPHKSLLACIVQINALGLALGFVFLMAYFNYRKMAGRTLHFSLMLMLATAAGSMLAAITSALGSGQPVQEAILGDLPQALLMGLGAGLFLAIPMAVVGGLRNKEYENITARLAFDAERERAARELSEARLRMLHAQIEPHFLFNTLGAVQQLAQKESPRAAALTADLIAFLRGSLGEMRSERVSLAADFGMIEAYLKVMAVRQGERLRFGLDLPPELAEAEVPSMMLLTLVENAIKHGIEPALRGGEIRIAAARAGTSLLLSVRDTGAGLAAQPGAGEGLANVRHRLQLLYGAAATLDVHGADDGGVLAQITLPLAEGKNIA